ncbi:transglycosylase domain-containing protein [Lachnoclostridium phytofermentans]|uniref:Penicillin-binding protein 1A n=1 Tax=Lachnoclostridium phytofermentans (strain ATCC 700394 / DSM 18823 / ISDg) TaxID=357809 RepID=A9KI50_LACP7|nr:transglycosylase domain-containing protein [Lachnoclostridium phytofermentans]ABX40884.1 glycosyl transferase family 51 [Lachnoclostridium phytofermentans ISDg]
MDFSRKGVIKKQRNIKSTSKRLNTKIRITLFRVSMISIVCLGIVGVIAISGAMKGIIGSAPDIGQVNIDPEGFASYIYYSDGTLAQKLIGAESNRVLVSIDKIPDVLQHAFVALEDERFYEHDGIDVYGIFRAGFSVLKTKDLGFGGSTITQQLIKAKVFNYGNEPNAVDKIVRKIQEQYLAIKLEDIYTKDEILEAYLNNINLGNGTYGVQTAAQSYFGKDVSELTLSEASVIAPIALSPVFRNPINYPAMNAERRQSCLDNMLRLGYITQKDYDAALADDVYSRIKQYNEEKAPSTYYSYFTDAVINQVLSDLQTKKGYTQDDASYMLFSNGLKIFSTQDKTIQGIVDKYFQDESNFPAIGEGSYYEMKYELSVYDDEDNATHYHFNDMLEYFKDFKDTEGLYFHEPYTPKVGINSLGYSKEDMEAKIEEFRNSKVKENQVYVEKKEITLQPQTSMTIMDQHNGNVVALYGGRGTKTGNRTTNRASSSKRQVGSTFKVLASFLPALDSGRYTLASVMDDSEYTYPNGKDTVTNWNKKYKGLSTMREGIYNSMNIIACRFMEAVTPRKGFDYLTSLGFDLVELKVKNGKTYTDIGVSLALGGITDGVTNVELTAGYAAIANGGVYNEPIYYTKVVDQNGKVILSNEPSSKQVMYTSTAWLLTNAMEDTIKRGTATSIGFRNYSMPIAGKTGTSTKDYDLWFVGYTPYYTSAIWTGFDYNFPQKEKSYHKVMWRNIMEEIHSTLKLENKAFVKPDSIVTARICTKSGQLAVPGLCDKALSGDCTRTEYFAKGTVPTQTCTVHQKVSICKVSGYFASPYCPLDSLVEKVFLIKDEKGSTDDKPYLLPTGDITNPCPIHSEGTVAPPTDEEDNETPIEPENPDDGNENPVEPTTTPPPVIIIPPTDNQP